MISSAARLGCAAACPWSAPGGDRRRGAHGGWLPASSRSGYDAL